MGTDTTRGARVTPSPRPRDIALAVWQRLAIQAARLTPEDLGPLSYWPFSAVHLELDDRPGHAPPGPAGTPATRRRPHSDPLEAGNMK